MRAVLAGLLLCAGIAAPVFAQAGDTAADPYSVLPSSVSLTGVVRDFKAREVSGGHPDFQRAPTSGFGHYVGQVADQLGPDGLPVFASTGFRVTGQWRNAAGQNIMSPRPYIAARPGDLAGARASTAGGSLTTSAAFSQWYRDVPGLNLSTTIPLTLTRTPGTNRYVFDDTLDPAYVSLGGFFPVNGQLYGNYASTGKNYHFTFALDTEFQYQRGAGHTFTFTGDDDVWVFVDGKLVIDIGGVHSKISQTIEVDRLNWLENGRVYSLKFFFAERHTTQSNFRIETTLNLRSVQPPTVSALAD